MMKYRTWLGILLLIPWLFLPWEIASAQSSQNFKIKKSVLDQGGTSSQSVQYKLRDAIGQPSPLSLATSPNFKEVSGFWAAIPPSQNPILIVSPTTLDFGTTENTKTFQITNGGGGTLTWTVAENPDKPWITSITPNSGSGNATVTVTVDRNQLTGNSDTGTLLVSSNGGNQNVTVLISKPAAGVPIYPVAASPQSAGGEFWVNVDVGNSNNPVANLFGVSFDLDFSNTAFIDVVTPYASNVLPGDFLGNDVVFFFNVDETGGKVNLAITRKAGTGGVNGSGTVAKIKFKADALTPNNTAIVYSITNVAANDPAGGMIDLTPGAATVIITSGITVWPGDTNDPMDPLNIVNQADVLPIGLHWGKTGPKRTCHPAGQEIMWMAHNATPWTPDKNATYADANGDGIVNQADVLVIGLNWGKTHTMLLANNANDGGSSSFSSAEGNMTNGDAELGPMPDPVMMKTQGHDQSELSLLDSAVIQLRFNGSNNPGQHFYIDVWVKHVTDLFGLSYELLYSPRDFLSLDSVKLEPNSLLGNDIIAFSLVDTTRKDTAKLSVAISRKFGQSGVTADSGLVTRIRAYMSPKAVIDTSQTKLWFSNIFANDPVGNEIPFKVDTTNLKCVTRVVTKAPKAVPDGFTLMQCYPNPFNPSTTIEYHLPQSADVSLTVYDLQGRLVRHLVKGADAAGYHSVCWDGRDEAGQVVASGIYFYQLEVKSRRQQSFREVKKMILMK
ncbi:MAG: T9SS type A sorting domain-containing protein [candidate division KSB1 bacterium]|nr:T9SS type A sorting domain-containing protein [candidate division KSB1 bacterium]